MRMFCNSAGTIRQFQEGWMYSNLAIGIPTEDGANK
jgi:hypothetical protein